MYLRHTTHKKNGKTLVYWWLVRSVRHGRKVVQETVAQLGELDAEGRARAQALARGITGDVAVSSQRQLFRIRKHVHAAHSNVRVSHIFGGAPGEMVGKCPFSK